jgi:hypothetical protein
MFGASFVLLTSRHLRLPGLFHKIEWYSTHQNMRAFTVTILYQHDSHNLARDWHFLNIIFVLMMHETRTRAV